MPRLAREVEPVDVDDRHDDRARRVHQVGRPSAPAVVRQQVIGELDRVFRGGPLARVVGAHQQEDRLAVPRVGILRDLDAVDVATLDRLVVERQLLDQPRVALGQLLELEVVVREVAIGVAAAGQLGLGVGRRELRVGRRVRLGARFEIGDAHVKAEARLAQLPLVGVAMQDDLDGVRVAVLGQIEVQALQPLLLLARGGADVHDLQLADGALRDRDVVDRQVGTRGAAAIATRLHAQLLSLLDEPLRELVGGEAGRTGQRATRAGVEDSEVPVALAGQSGADQPGDRGGRRDRLRACGATDVLRVARARDCRRCRDLLAGCRLGRSPRGHCADGGPRQDEHECSLAPRGGSRRLSRPAASSHGGSPIRRRPCSAWPLDPSQ